MAKKKLSGSVKEKTLPKQEDFVKAHQEVTPSMDAQASEKLENLKSLNQILLKEASDRRQQVNSLLQSIGSLGMELSLSHSEKEVLQSELIRLGESAASLELERCVSTVFVSVQLDVKGEMIQREMSELRRVVDVKESEIARLKGKLRETEGALGNEREVSERLCLERDEIKGKLDLQLEEDNVLKASMIVFEERKREIEQELGELRAVYDAVVAEKGEMQTWIESTQKDLIERSLMESKLMEEMKEKVSRVVKENARIEMEKTAEMVRTKELENTINGLNEMVVNLQKEEIELRVTVAELEKKCFVDNERHKERVREIDQLIEENKLSEKKIEELASDKTAMEWDLSEALKQFAEEKHRTEVMHNENIVMLEAKGRLESEVSALRNQVAELNAVILKMEESSEVEVDKIKRLESEVGDYRYNLDQVKKERDEMKIYLDEEKQNALRLKKKVGALEHKIEESLKVSEKVNASSAALSAEKAELERQREMLKNKISSLEITITEAQEEFDLMKGKVELADANSVLVLKMLKDTAAFCLKDEIDGDLPCNDEEKKEYVVELEMIQNAFKNKAVKIGNMKRQLELLQSSVDDAHRKKSLWTVLTSATTLLAAVSLAYVARGH